MRRRTIDDPKQFNLPIAQERKETGMARALARDPIWHGNAYMLIVRHAPWGEIFLFEIVKDIPGIGIPRVPQCWGALANHLVKDKMIRPATPEERGGYVKSHSRKNNAHKYQLYVRVGNEITGNA